MFGFFNSFSNLLARKEGRRNMRFWLCGIAVTTLLFAQQDPQFSMYMFNRQYINPAYAGAMGSTNITFAGRTQWVGIDGSPRSMSLIAHKPVALLHGGVGIQVLADYIGPFQTIDAKLAYAFHLPVGQKGAQLQFGVQGGVLYKVLDGTNWRPPDNPNDPILVDAVTNATAPDFGAGVYFQLPNEKLYVGVAGLHLLEPSMKQLTLGQRGELRIVRHLLFSAGTRFDLSENVSLMPSTLFKMAGGQMQIDINANVMVSPLVFGVSYRYQDAIVGILGFQISERIFAAYSYDYTLSNLSVATSGTHEILISYTLPPVFKIYPPDLGVRDKRTFR